MRPLLISLLLLFTFTTQAQLVLYKYGKDSIPVYLFGDTLGGAAMYSGYEGSVDTTVTYLQIDKAAFDKYKKAAVKTDIDTSRKRVQWLDTTFVVKGIKNNFTYLHRKKDGQYDVTLYDYIGYIKSLKLYIISWVDSRNEIGGTYFLDNQNGKYYDVQSAHSYRPELPIISPGGKYLLLYENDGYELDDASIIIYSITKGKQGNEYHNFWSVKRGDGGYNVSWNFPTTILDFEYKPKKWMIDDMVWVNDKTIAFKIYHRGEEKQNYAQVDVTYVLAQIGKRPPVDE